jgi:hypothetical protein
VPTHANTHTYKAVMVRSGRWAIDRVRQDTDDPATVKRVVPETQMSGSRAEDVASALREAYWAGRCQGREDDETTGRRR